MPLTLYHCIHVVCLQFGWLRRPLKTDLLMKQGEALASIEEQEEEEMDPKKEVIKVVDILGRETTIQPNMLLIYIYSDGSASAVIQVD